MAYTNTDNECKSVSKATSGPRRSKSVKETCGKIEKRGNLKTVRALSTRGRSDVGGEEDKKVKDTVKGSNIVKGGENMERRTSIRSTRIGQRKESDGI